eukprot:TRINITY_DN4879_c1_g1_i1.p3 TRINITY_DN4879_c1_g1~~TRINITY_DN4879_c1_g1_i1.p3  ORF type:complete len:113 (-),score=11.03 TRINITY_DN4879_c1_g1_i1:238-576(-)
MSFQINLASVEDWKTEIEETQGVVQVVEMYRDWCGPSKAIQATFKRIYFDLGDHPLKFYTANVDKIDHLTEYRNDCEPVFLFYKDNQILQQIKGVNAPELSQKILGMFQTTA